MSDLSVRAATKDDVDTLFFMLVEMAKENSKHRVTVGKALEHINSVVACGGCAVVENEEREIVATAGISVQQSWFSDDKFLGDSWFYVRPDYRSTRAAFMLKKALFNFSDTAGLDLVLAVFSFVDGDRKSKFFAKSMKHLGGSYVKEFKNGLHVRE